jgi:medium-chain acyl-[acyl-carrier-protein] hydrolase
MAVVQHTCSVPFRVRFDEAGPDGLLRTSSLLRYAQDLASYHSAERGFDRAWYAERGLAWLARAAVVAIERPVAHGITMTGTTLVTGERRVWARRRTEFVDEDGSLVAWTHVDWVLLDARGAPTRIPPAFEASFGTPQATFPLGRVPLEATPVGAARLDFTVRPQELDPMDHVNNAVYADWLDEAVLAAGGTADVRAVPRVIRLEYARSAGPGASLFGDTWRADDGWSHRLSERDGAELLRGRLERGPSSPGA